MRVPIGAPMCTTHAKRFVRKNPHLAITLENKRQSFCDECLPFALVADLRPSAITRSWVDVVDVMLETKHWPVTTIQY